jgi:hypothetical protein
MHEGKETHEDFDLTTRKTEFIKRKLKCNKTLMNLYSAQLTITINQPFKA